MSRSKPSNTVLAPFASLCDHCSNHIAAGDAVVRLLDIRYICAACISAGVED